MAFYEVQFPQAYSYGAVGGCGWSTRVVVTDAGFEYRNQMWANTRGEWHVGHNLRKPADYAALLAFHRLTQGKTYGFRFRDWTDYTDEAGPLTGTGGGIIRADRNGALRLYKAYSFTDLFSTTFTTYRPIQKPVPGTVVITSRSSYVIDYTSGIVTTHGSVVANDAWTGQFDVPVRFDVDRPDLSVDLPSGAGWRGIPIVEVRIADSGI